MFLNSIIFSITVGFLYSFFALTLFASVFGVNWRTTNFGRGRGLFVYWITFLNALFSFLFVFSLWKQIPFVLRLFAAFGYVLFFTYFCLKFYGIQSALFASLNFKCLKENYQALFTFFAFVCGFMFLSALGPILIENPGRALSPNLFKWDLGAVVVDVGGRPAEEISQPALGLKMSPLEATIDFSKSGNSSKYTLFGFAQQEEDSRWTLGRQAILCFSLPEGFSKGQTFLMNVSPFLGKRSYQRMIARINGVIQFQKNIHKRETLLFDLDPALFLNNEICINFEFPDAQSPLEAGISGDARILGFAFFKVAIIEKSNFKRIKR